MILERKAKERISQNFSYIGYEGNLYASRYKGGVNLTPISKFESI